MRASPFVVRATGTGLRAPTNPIRGTDAAGEVEAVGKDVTRLRPGDEVFGWCQGAFAEYVCADESHFVPKPADLSFESAAAIPLAGCTALQGLRDTGAVEPGQHVLIIGAGGGVGTFAVQIAKELGCRVTGVCSTAKLDLVRSLGADHAIDYTREDFTRGEQRYDLILQLAGTASPSACRRALTPTGTLALSSGEGRFAGIDRVLRALVIVTARTPAAPPVPHEGDQRGPRDPGGARRSRQGHAGHRQDLSAERRPRGDRVSRRGTRSREGRDHGLRRG